MHVLGADEGGGGKHADDKSVNKATEMMEDVSEGESEESNSEDDIILTELIEASDCESEQGTARGSTRQDYSLHASDKGRGILLFQLSHQNEACTIEI